MIDAGAILTFILAATPCMAPPGALDIIPRYEGFYKPHSLTARLHNPGALKYVGQPYSLGRGPAGFARFASDDDGFAALTYDLEYKLRYGKPLGRAWRYLRKYDAQTKKEPTRYPSGQPLSMLTN